MLLILAFIATPAIPRAAGAAPAAAPGPKKYYTLKARPAIGQSIAYEQSMDSKLHIISNPNNTRRAESLEQFHDQTVVQCEQIIEIGKPPSMSKMVTFGPQCWSAVKINDREPRKVGSIYAGKQVLFRIFEDGTLEQDFGVKPTREQMQRMKNMFVAAADLYPQRPVAIGERWRADRAMAGVLDLAEEDTSSTICTLKEVRSDNGREIAVVAVSAGIIKLHERGFNVEMALEGSWEIDLATGAELKIDVAGKCSIAVASPKGKKRNPAVATEREVTGEGIFELHRSGRLLATQETPATPKGDATANTSNP